MYRTFKFISHTSGFNHNSDPENPIKWLRIQMSQTMMARGVKALKSINNRTKRWTKSINFNSFKVLVRSNRSRCRENQTIPNRSQRNYKSGKCTEMNKKKLSHETWKNSTSMRSRALIRCCWAELSPASFFWAFEFNRIYSLTRVYHYKIRF